MSTITRKTRGRSRTFGFLGKSSQVDGKRTRVTEEEMAQRRKQKQAA